MEKVTVKIELDRNDIETAAYLSGHKLSDEYWEKMKGKECILCNEDMGEQAVSMKLAFSCMAIINLLKDEL